MLPYVESTQFSLGPLVIHTWGLFASLGMVLASVVAVHEARRRGIDTDRMLTLILWSLIAAFIGARVAYVANEWGELRADPAQVFALWDGGLASWGGIVGIVVTLAVLTRRWRVRFWQYADIIALAAPIGLGCGRIGCSLIHDHLGRETTLPWGIETPDGTIRHEPSYYLVLANVVLFLMLWRLARRQSLPPGALTVVFLIGQGLTRLVLDTFRAADLSLVDPRFGALTVAQYFFLVQIAVGLGLWAWLRRPSRTQTA